MKSKTYEDFVGKFKPKLTTDDCMTPPEVYEAVLDYACRRYGVDPRKAVRPFWPGGDYKSFDYSGGAVVIDNPPFSILAKIRRFYMDRGIRYFLFAPSLTLFSSADLGDTFIPTSADITYANGANVRTSFVTNMDDPDLIVRTYPDLLNIVQDANDAILKQQKRSVPKYVFPDHVLTAAKSGWLCIHGIEYRLFRRDCVKISTLDAMKAAGKSGIFGGAFLLSERAAAERAAAERAAAERAAADVWELSDRERRIVKMLSNGAPG